ncbi:MAG TPA: hypothetical protein VFG54_12375 [Prolixibacteraceae bacterium]|nr:hypothetical protein [Prolixibacteraceae bacterium]
MTTVNRMKLLTQKNDARVAIVMPTELKRIIAEKAKRDNTNESQWVKLAIIEKLEREDLEGKI